MNLQAWPVLDPVSPRHCWAQQLAPAGLVQRIAFSARAANLARHTAIRCRVPAVDTGPALTTIQKSFGTGSYDFQLPGLGRRCVGGGGGRLRLCRLGFVEK